MNIPREINRLRSKRWRLNEKFLRLTNDGYAYDSPEVQKVLKKIDELDYQIRLLKVGRVGYLQEGNDG